MIYNHWVVSKSDFYTDEFGAIYKVLNIEAIRSIQYRVLVPLIFKLLSLPHLIPDKAIFLFIIIIFTYFTLLIFYFTLNVYFQNRTLNYILAPIIIYPMIWNFILLNQTFFFVDNSILFFMTAGLYFILTKQNKLLIILFFLATLNHYSSGFLIVIYLLYNYKRLFRKETILFTIGLIIIYIGCFSLMRIIFPNLPELKDDGFVVWAPQKALDALKELPKHILIRDIFLNYGGIHFFVLLLFLCGIWKKIQREYIFVYYIIIPYVIFAVLRLGIRMEEMRNWIPLIPFVTLLSLIFLSQIENPLLKLSENLKLENTKK